MKDITRLDVFNRGQLADFWNMLTILWEEKLSLADFMEYIQNADLMRPMKQAEIKKLSPERRQIRKRWRKNHLANIRSGPIHR